MYHESSLFSSLCFVVVVRSVSGVLLVMLCCKCAYSVVFSLSGNLPYHSDAIYSGGEFFSPVTLQKKKLKGLLEYHVC